MARDYYDILGISRNADQDEIKRAYRRQARKYHPDVNKDPGAEETFKEINKAYEVLSEPEMKARYDRFGEAGVSGAGAGAGGFQDFGDMGGFADIFETFFSGFSGGVGTGARRRGPMRGDDLRLDLKLDFKDAIFGGEKKKLSSAIKKPAVPVAVVEPSRALVLLPVQLVAVPGKCAGLPALPLGALPRCLPVQPVAALAKSLKTAAKSVAVTA